MAFELSQFYSVTVAAGSFISLPTSSPTLRDCAGTPLAQLPLG